MKFGRNILFSVEVSKISCFPTETLAYCLVVRDANCTYDTMAKSKGLSNRLRHQGMPAKLDEGKMSKKRKVATPTQREPQSKKRRTLDGAAEAIKPPQPSSLRSHRTQRSPANGTSKKFVGSAMSSAKAETPRKAQLLSESGEDDEVDGPDEHADRVFEKLEDLEEEELEELEEEPDDVMVSDGEEDTRDFGMWSEDEDGDLDELEKANAEAVSNRLDAQAAREAAEAQAELEEAAMQTNIAGDTIPDLDEEDDNEPGLKTRLAPDLQLLRTRITDTIRILSELKEHKPHEKHEGRSRAEYVQGLLRDICAYYGYSSFLAEKLFNLFPAQEAFAFFEANETPRPVVVRTNTLRTHRRELAQTLMNRGVQLEPVGKWSKVGLQIFESAVPLGATPEYLAGHYIIQAASSFLPVMALAPQENERILDMASAPGGKTTHIAALMKNTGVVFANDSNKDRAKALIGNVHRLGVKNAIICNHNAMDFPKVMGGFDRVLLDAPCSGTGVIAKDASVKTNKTEADFLRLPHLQKQLLLAAIDSVDHKSKTGGYIVYSTCSVTVEENEQVVQYVLNKRPNVKLVETGLTFGREGFTAYMGKKFHPSMKMTRRYYPHAYNVDGFFVSKFKKLGPTPPASTVNGDARRGAGEVAEETGATALQADVPDELEEQEDEFGRFDEEEDGRLIEKALLKHKKRRGQNPKADPRKAKDRSMANR